MVADRIKALRESMNMTQSELARHLGITRSGVNAWEMGISVPSTQYIVELAKIFKVSSDYLLGMDLSATLSLEGLSDDDIKIIHSLVKLLRDKNGEPLDR